MNTVQNFSSPLTPADRLFEQAVAHHQSGRAAEAEALYRTILAQIPDHSDSMHLLGVLALQRGNAAAAVEHIQSAIRLSPDVAFYYSNLGSAYRQTGQKTEEEKAYRKALAIDPNLTPAQNNLTTLLREQGRADDIESLKKSLVLQQQRHAYLIQYQNEVNRLRTTPYMDFPGHIHLETLAKCNAACVFCPYPELDRQGERMPDDLIYKILRDLTDIPRHVEFQLSPFKVNEPFLDVRLFDILTHINDTLPHASLTLTTNASAVTEKNLAALNKVKKLDYLWISFNDHRKEDYEATMKLPYARTIERLNMIHRKKSSGEFALRVVLSRVGDGSGVDYDFAAWVKETYPLFESSVVQRGNWIGQVKDIEQEVPRVGCVRWFDLSITATGIVAHCCMDGQAKWPVGDVRTQHVLEIYNSPHYRQLREKTLIRRDASPCNMCAFL